MIEKYEKKLKDVENEIAKISKKIDGFQKQVCLSSVGKTILKQNITKLEQLKIQQSLLKEIINDLKKYKIFLYK